MKLAETLSALRERIQQRVEGRAPEVPDFRLPSLEALAGRHQADEKWAAQVGTVNPRPPGLHNKLVQALKHLVARSMRWFVRPQREFDRAVLDAMDEIRQLFADQNRNLLVLAQVTEAADRARREVPAELERLHETVGTQHRSLDGRIMANVTRLDDALQEIQQNITRHRDEHLKLHAEGKQWLEEEVRLVRQRLRNLTGADVASGTSTGGLGAPAVPAFDYPYFERRFRGSEQEVRERQKAYVEFFRQRGPVLDLACGRGEFLSLLRENGIAGRGVDRDADMAARCREQDLEVACGDVFAFLEATPDGSLGGIFSAQFIEHLPTAAYVRLVELAYRKLRSGGALLLETQNPECLAIYSQSFFVDPTHVRPVPAAQLRFWMGEAGFRELRTHYVSPVAPQLPQLPLLEPKVGNAGVERWNQEAARFNQIYFGYQDYALLGIKP